jgi:uncharacterized membrane protein YqgA involved in biofilm formation
MKALALCVIYIGIDGALSGEKTLVAILSMVIGTVIGQILSLEERLERLGELIEQKFKDKNGNSSISQGFITATLLFCVGSMAINGSFQSGFNGNHELLYIKSLLDGISSVVFASTLGIGVMLSAPVVFAYQGTLTMLAALAGPFLSAGTIAEMTCVGSILIIALGLNMLGITKLKVMNMIPAIFVPLILCLFM